MMNNAYLRFVFSLLVAFSIFAVSLPRAGYAQAPAQAAASADYSRQLQIIEEKTEARRKELGIPGMSLVILKDDQIIFMKGFGYKDFENKIAATPDTQFAIGSTTKAMTALTVLMSQEEGKLSLDDSPKKHLPYFKINDAEIDKNITVRDLLNHSSGLGGTDLMWLPGKITREEIIRAAGEAKPTAKLREKFQYQNVMYAAAGEVVAKVQKKPWEQVISDRIFAPLGMTNSNFSVLKMQKAKDFSFGYRYDSRQQETNLLPFRNIDEIGPAGSINSSARDMAQWVRFVLNGGTVNGKRLISDASYAEWFKPQMRISPRYGYGLGWNIGGWNGEKLVFHSGGIDGFNAQVAMLPEKKLGFVMLTNVSSSSLGGDLQSIIWENILGKPAPPVSANAPVPPEKEAGKYHFAEAGFDVDIEWKDGKLIANVPSQPVYTFENVGGRRYKLNGAPEGFFVTFKDNELYLEQPQGNYTLPRIGGDAKTAKSDPTELIGAYMSQSGGNVEIKESDGKVSLNIPGQQPYALVEKSGDAFSLSPLPDTYTLKTKRDAAGKITSFVVIQPEGEFEFKRIGAAPEYKADITVDELAQKTIQAAGGEANWRKLTARVVETDVDFENQGLRARVISYAKAPNKAANETTLTAIGKTIGTSFDYFDGTTGEQSHSFAPVEKFSGTRLDDARLNADFYSTLDWRTNYKKVAIMGMGKVGGEDAYIVAFEPKSGTNFKQYFSTKTFFLLKQEGGPSGTSVFSDYRDIDGIKYAFKIVNSNPGNGTGTFIVRSVKHNVPVDDKMFAPRMQKPARQ